MALFKVEAEGIRPATAALGPKPQTIELTRWRLGLVAVDLAGITAAAALGVSVRFDGTAASVLGVSYAALGAALLPAWIAVLALAGAYDARITAAGPDLYRRAVTGFSWLLAGAAFASFALHANLSRGFVGITLPTALALTLIGRYAVRKGLHSAIVQGTPIHRVIVVGGADAAADLIAHVRRAAYAGFHVVGVALDGAGGTLPADVDLVGRAPDALVGACHRLGADTIAVAGVGGFTAGALRRLAWQLEGTGIQLIVAPALTDIAGPRIVVRPVDGLPLLHVDEPELVGVRRVIKDWVERAAAVGLALVLAPLLIGIAVTVRLTSPGAAVYRQARIGRNGRPFTLFKFRTMVDGADRLVDGFIHLNESDAVLFKIREDPRVTGVGRWLRRHSLDELPQLLNVIRGDMSLVGPRPPLAVEVARYGDDVRRRLLVKPGMTGLWQVSGRNDLSWEESVRLDLYYVENWSVALDAMVLWKTLAAVIHGRGAY